MGQTVCKNFNPLSCGAVNELKWKKESERDPTHVKLSKAAFCNMPTKPTTNESCPLT